MHITMATGSILLYLSPNIHATHLVTPIGVAPGMQEVSLWCGYRRDGFVAYIIPYALQFLQDLMCMDFTD